MVATEGMAREPWGGEYKGWSLQMAVTFSHLEKGIKTEKVTLGPRAIKLTSRTPSACYIFNTLTDIYYNITYNCFQ